MNYNGKKPIKVLQMAPLGAGGITSLVLNLADNLDTSRVQFDYLTFYDRKEFNEEKALSHGGKKILVPIDKYSNRIIRGLYKFFGTIYILKKENIDIIHINASFPYDILVGVSAKIAGIRKVVFHSHNSSMKTDTSLRGKIMPICKKMIPIVSDCNIACSELAAQFMFPKSILEETGYSIVNNGIDAQRYAYNESVRNEYRGKLGLEDRFVIGHIGRFTKQKNHKRLIEIFKALLREKPDAVLLLVGVGELMDEIKEMVVRDNIEDSVLFYGATPEVPNLLQAMDFFLFPSLYEGLPVVGVEVQAAGLPILMSDSITTEVKITDLAQYYSLENSDECWAKKIIEMSQVFTERRKTTQEIKNAGFDIADVTEKLMCLYEHLLD